MYKVGVLRRVLNTNDVQIDDRDFDKLALIDSETPEIAAAFLTEQRRRVITELLGTRGIRDAVVTEREMGFHTRKVELSIKRLVGNILGMVEFARIMSVDGKLTPSGTLEALSELKSYFAENAEHGEPEIQDAVR